MENKIETVKIRAGNNYIDVKTELPLEKIDIVTKEEDLENTLELDLNIGD